MGENVAKPIHWPLVFAALRITKSKRTKIKNLYLIQSNLVFVMLIIGKELKQEKE